MRSSTGLWNCDDVFEGVAVAMDASGDIWAEPSVVGDGRSRDFHFPWYVVKCED